ncbi:MAG: hypothetical protein CfClM3_1216 [Methanobrevibacter sp. CfCl-M3]
MDEQLSDYLVSVHINNNTFISGGSLFKLSDYLVSVHRHYNISYIVKEAAMAAEHITSFNYWKKVFNDKLEQVRMNFIPYNDYHPVEVVNFCRVLDVWVCF